MVMVIPVVSAELTKEEVDSLTSIEKTVNNLEISLEASLKSLETSSNTCNDVKTLINNKPIMTMHGTEYQVGDNAKVWIQLLTSNQTTITNALCYIDIYTPSNTFYLERATMTNMNHDGIYYYDLTAPSVVGVYSAIALCYYTAGQVNYLANEYFIMNGSYNGGTIQDTYSIENTAVGSLEFKEEASGNPRRLQVGVNFTNETYCNVSEGLLTGITLKVNSKFGSLVGDDLTIALWNYTSNSWYNFPNKVPAGNIWGMTTNSLVFNNITKTGFVNSSGSNIRVKFLDTNLTDGSTSTFSLDYIQLSCDELTTPLAQEVRGSSELHITDFVNNLNASIGSPSAIADAVWNYNGTINLNVLIQIAGEVWNWSGGISSNILDLISGNVWTYSERNLTYTPDQNISTQVVNVSIDENTIADAVWTHTPDRNLTFYETSNVTVNGTDIAQQVWNYNGTINDNILNQVADKVQCYVNQLFSTEDGQWGIDISAC